ncbi:MAG: 3-keto-disaccharide hydrolase, partial [Armatimonadota bacterium]
AEGQAKGNSGVFLQGRYEIQVLDSYGWERPGLGDCGAIYNQHAPLVNACTPPEQWQSYDIIFRAPRLDEQGEVIEYPRMTVFQNGILIQNNAVLTGPTGGQLDEKVGEPGPLMLQDHGDLVSFRNIWLVHLPEESSSSYEPG